MPELRSEMCPAVCPIFAFHHRGGSEHFMHNTRISALGRWRSLRRPDFFIGSDARKDGMLLAEYYADRHPSPETY